MKNEREIKEIQRKIQQLNQQFQKMGGEVDEEIKENLENYRDALADKSKKLWETTKSKGMMVDEYVNENPWKATGMAFAVGVIVGWIMYSTKER